MVKVSVVTLMLGLGLGLAWIIGENLSESAMWVIVGIGGGMLASLPVTLIMLRVVRRSTIAEMDVKREMRVTNAPAPSYQMPPNIFMVPTMPGAQQQPAKGGIIPNGTFRPINGDDWG